MLRALGFDKSSVITVFSQTFEACNHQLLDDSDIGYGAESPSAALESVVSEIDFFVCSTGSLTVFTFSQKKTLNNATSRGLTSMPWRKASV